MFSQASTQTTAVGEIEIVKLGETDESTTMPGGRSRDLRGPYWRTARVIQASQWPSPTAEMISAITSWAELKVYIISVLSRWKHY